MIRVLWRWCFLAFVSTASAQEKFSMTYEQWKKDPVPLQKLLQLDPQPNQSPEVAKQHEGWKLFRVTATGYGLAYIQLGNPRALKRKILVPMKESGYDVDLLWIVPTSHMDSTRPEVDSPGIHYTAEVPSDRLPFLRALRDYYRDERKRPDIFTDILNAKNTDGMTLLDYIEFLTKNQKVLEAQKKPLEELKEFVIANGGKSSKF